MSGVATAIAGGAIVGAAISSDAARKSAHAQADAAKNASDSSLQQFNTINAQQEPYRTSGYGALADLNNFLGITTSAPQMTRETFDADAYLKAHPELADPKVWWQGTTKGGQVRDLFTHWQESGANPNNFTGTNQFNQQLAQSKVGPNTPGFGQFTHQFNANDLNANLAPNYGFMLDQGQRATNNLNNSTNGLLSGNALQGLDTFTQNYAKNAYQDAFNNYNTNQTNIYNRLASLAGLGQTSLNASANYGTQLVNSSNNYLTSAAAANAAGTVGQANALSGALNSLGTAGAYYGMTH